MKQLKGDTWEFINRSKHRRCISSVPQLNRNSIEFSLSTWTWSVIKSTQAKSLHHTPEMHYNLPSGESSEIRIRFLGYVLHYIYFYSPYIPNPIVLLARVRSHQVKLR